MSDGVQTYDPVGSPAVAAYAILGGVNRLGGEQVNGQSAAQARSCLAWLADACC